MYVCMFVCTKLLTKYMHIATFTESYIIDGHSGGLSNLFPCFKKLMTSALSTPG